MSATKILWGQIALIFAIVLATMWAATQWVMAGSRRFGSPAKTKPTPPKAQSHMSRRWRDRCTESASATLSEPATGKPRLSGSSDSPLALSSLAEGSKPVAFAYDHLGEEVGEGADCADGNEILEREI